MNSQVPNQSLFPWQAFRVVLDGLSVIDVPQLDIQDEAHAHAFLTTYGYDLFLDSHRDQIWKIYKEACEFIEENLCPEGLEFPKVLKDHEVIGDFRRLLLIVAGHDQYNNFGREQPYRLWICAALRVMHVIAHVQSDLRLRYLPKIKRQTVDRFEAHIQRSEVEGRAQIFLGFERDKVPLVAFSKKEEKVRQSILLKLLQRAEGVATGVFDHLGVRLVTQNRMDVFWVLKYLLEHQLVSYPNVLPSRCRNSLVVLQQFEKLLQDAPSLNRESADYREWAIQAERMLAFPDLEASKSNPFSSRSYRSIQFTSYPLIRIPVVKKGKRAEISFFFPFEVQILDQGTFSEVDDGGASDHLAYKARQLESVRVRVLGDLIAKEKTS